jgi:hypothetical protein
MIGVFIGLVASGSFNMLVTCVRLLRCSTTDGSVLMVERDGAAGFRSNLGRSTCILRLNGLWRTVNYCRTTAETNAEFVQRCETAADGMIPNVSQRPCPVSAIDDLKMSSSRDLAFPFPQAGRRLRRSAVVNAPGSFHNPS